MDTTSVNLPQVIQQAGDVSRVQEMVQRSPQAQQAAAQHETARQQEQEKGQVLGSEHTHADNNVQVGGHAQERETPRRRPRRQAAQAPEEEPAPLHPEGGSLVDIIV